MGSETGEWGGEWGGRKEKEDKQETQMKGGKGDKKIYEEKCVSVTGGGA